MVERYDEELFLEYVEGELPVDKRVAFENQMLQDPRLRNLVAQMVLDRHRVRSMPDEVPPEHLMDAVRERLERSMLLGATPQEFNAPQRPTHTGFRWRRMITMGAMAAMVAVVAGVFIVTFVQLANDTPIRNIGPGSLFPPGVLPPSLTTRNTTANPTQNIVKPPAKPADDASSTSPSLAVGPKITLPSQATTQPAVTTTPPATQPTIPTPPTTAGQNATGVAAPPGELPEAQVIFKVTTSNAAAAKGRLISWINAYQAKLLDVSEIKAASDNASSTAKSSRDSAASIANQALTIESPAVAPSDVTSADAPSKAPAAAPAPLPARKSVSASAAPVSSYVVTLVLHADLVLPLETFLATLPDVAVLRTDRQRQVSMKEQAMPFALTTPATMADNGDSDTQFKTYVLRDRQTVSAKPTNQWVDQILPDWLMHPESAPISATTADAGHKDQDVVVRVQFFNKP